MRAAIYARVSTDRQAEHGTSLDSQLERCRARAVSEGWEVVDEFVDRGVSGATDSRPALDKMLEAIDTGRIDTVIVAALDRIGRSAKHLVTLFATFDTADVRVVSIRESIDSSTPVGRMLRTILVALAELERELIRERMAHGRLAAAQSGTWVSGELPWGLTRNADNEIEVDDDALETIERITELIVDEGLSPWQAAPILNAEGLLTRRRSRWTPDGLRTFLRRTTDTERWAGHIITKIDDGLGLGEVEIDVPQVLAPERLAALRVALDAPAQARTRKARVATYPLSGLVTMPCGGHLTGIWRRDRETRTYRCSNYPNMPERPSCGCPTIDCDNLEQRVWKLVATKFTADNVDSLAHAGTNDNAETVTAAVESATTLQQRIKRLENAAGQKAAELLAADVDPKVVAAAVKQIEADLAATRHRHRQLIEWERAAVEHQITGDRINAARQTILTRLDDPTLTEMNDLVRLLDVKVTVTGWRPCDDERCVNGRLKENRRRNCPTCARRGKLPVLDITMWMPTADVKLGDLPHAAAG